MEKKTYSLKDYIIYYCGEMFLCTSFTNVDPDETGVGITRESDHKHIGEIIGLSLPNEEDEEQVIKFEEQFANWMNENY